MNVINWIRFSVYFETEFIIYFGDGEVQIMHAIIYF